MKQAVAFVMILAVAGAGLYFAQRRNHSDQVSANAVVDVAADWQHDLSRVPMHLTRISDEQEIRIGNQLAQQYGSQGTPEAPELRATEKYVGEVGAKLAAQANRKLPYRFHVVADANMVNAFALPGGHVFVGRGLLDRMKSEDELAFVLGHEIEHVDHHHAVERVQVEAQLHKMDLDVVGEITQIPVSIWQAAYSKDEEFEADREGLRLSSAAGYSPRGAINALEELARLRREYVIHAADPTDELSQLAVEGLNGYFRSHPLPSERIAQAREVIAEDRLPMNRPLKPFHVEYEITAADR
ncbi:MAG TPA: M48 family metalloprotease [Terracidiphilus sp.]|jgi:predicted Zn-dependent protease